MVGHLKFCLVLVGGVIIFGDIINTRQSFGTSMAIIS